MSADPWLARQQHAEEVYEALSKSGRLKGQRVITYRCSVRRCLLLDVVSVPEMVIAHRPRYKTSPTVTAKTSSASGRAAHTEDGEGKWQSWTGVAGDQWNFTLTCDHVHSVVVDKSELQGDVDGGHDSMTVTPDGQRSAV